MEQFTVPQFIDIEAKIIGPITARQFILMIIAAFLVFIAYKLADFTLFILEAILIIGIFGVFAFLKINGRPFHYFVVNIIQTLKRPKLRVWNKETTYFKIKEEKGLKKEKVTPSLSLRKPPLRQARLSELALIVNTGGAYREEE